MLQLRTPREDCRDDGVEDVVKGVVPRRSCYPLASSNVAMEKHKEMVKHSWKSIYPLLIKHEMSMENTLIVGYFPIESSLDLKSPSH